MMQSFATTNAVGHVGADPITRGSQEKPFVTFSFAVNHKSKEGNETVEKTDWYRVNVPAYLVNFVQKCVRKGDPVAVSGPSRIQKWTQNGESFSGICIYANLIKLLGSKSEKATLSSECVEEPSAFEMVEGAEREADAEFSPPYGHEGDRT